MHAYLKKHRFNKNMQESVQVELVLEQLVLVSSSNVEHRLVQLFKIESQSLAVCQSYMHVLLVLVH